MFSLLFAICMWIQLLSSGAGGGGAAVEREAGIARAVLLTRGATRERHTPWHPDTDWTWTSVSGCCQIWHVVTKHATFVVSYGMLPTRRRQCLLSILGPWCVSLTKMHAFESWVSHSCHPLANAWSQKTISDFCRVPKGTLRYFYIIPTLKN